MFWSSSSEELWELVSQSGMQISGPFFCNDKMARELSEIRRKVDEEFVEYEAPDGSKRLIILPDPEDPEPAFDRASSRIKEITVADPQNMPTIDFQTKLSTTSIRRELRLSALRDARYNYFGDETPDEHGTPILFSDEDYSSYEDTDDESNGDKPLADINFAIPIEEADDDDDLCCIDDIQSKENFIEELTQITELSDNFVFVNNSGLKQNWEEEQNGFQFQSEYNPEEDVKSSINIDVLIVNHCRRIFNMIEDDYHRVSTSMLRELVNKMFGLLLRLQLTDKGHRNKDWLDLVAHAVRIRLKLFQIFEAHTLVYTTERVVIFLTSLSEQLMEICSNNPFLCLNVLIRISEFKRADEFKQSNLLKKLIRFILEDLVKKLVIDWRDCNKDENDPVCNESILCGREFMVTLLALKKIKELELKITGELYEIPRDASEILEPVPKPIIRYTEATRLVRISETNNTIVKAVYNSKHTSIDIEADFYIFAEINLDVDDSKTKIKSTKRLIKIPNILNIETPQQNFIPTSHDRNEISENSVNESILANIRIPNHVNTPPSSPRITEATNVIDQNPTNLSQNIEEMDSKLSDLHINGGINEITDLTRVSKNLSECIIDDKISDHCFESGLTPEQSPEHHTDVNSTLTNSFSSSELVTEMDSAKSEQNSYIESQIEENIITRNPNPNDSLRNLEIKEAVCIEIEENGMEQTNTVNHIQETVEPEQISVTESRQEMKTAEVIGIEIEKNEEICNEKVEKPNTETQIEKIDAVSGVEPEQIFGFESNSKSDDSLRNLEINAAKVLNNEIMNVEIFDSCNKLNETEDNIEANLEPDSVTDHIASNATLSSPIQIEIKVNSIPSDLCDKLEQSSIVENSNLSCQSEEISDLHNESTQIESTIETHLRSSPELDQLSSAPNLACINSCEVQQNLEIYVNSAKSKNSPEILTNIQIDLTLDNNLSNSIEPEQDIAENFKENLEIQVETIKISDISRLESQTIDQPLEGNLKLTDPDDNLIEKPETQLEVIKTPEISQISLDSQDYLIQKPEAQAELTFDTTKISTLDNSQQNLQPESIYEHSEVINSQEISVEKPETRIETQIELTADSSQIIILDTSEENLESESKNSEVVKSQEIEAQITANAHESFSNSSDEPTISTVDLVEKLESNLETPAVTQNLLNNSITNSELSPVTEIKGSKIPDVVVLNSESIVETRSESQNLLHNSVTNLEHVLVTEIERTELPDIVEEIVGNLQQLPEIETEVQVSELAKKEQSCMKSKLKPISVFYEPNVADLAKKEESCLNCVVKPTEISEPASPVLLMDSQSCVIDTEPTTLHDQEASSTNNLKELEIESEFQTISKLTDSFKTHYEPPTERKTETSSEKPSIVFVDASEPVSFNQNLEINQKVITKSLDEIVNENLESNVEMNSDPLQESTLLNFVNSTELQSTNQIETDSNIKLESKSLNDTIQKLQLNLAAKVDSFGLNQMDKTRDNTNEILISKRGTRFKDTRVSERGSSNTFHKILRSNKTESNHLITQISKNENATKIERKKRKSETELLTESLPGEIQTDVVNKRKTRETRSKRFEGLISPPIENALVTKRDTRSSRYEGLNGSLGEGNKRGTRSKRLETFIDEVPITESKSISIKSTKGSTEKLEILTEVHCDNILSPKNHSVGIKSKINEILGITKHGESDKLLEKNDLVPEKSETIAQIDASIKSEIKFHENVPKKAKEGVICSPSSPSFLELGELPADLVNKRETRSKKSETGFDEVSITKSESLSIKSKKTTSYSSNLASKKSETTLQTSNRSVTSIDLKSEKFKIDEKIPKKPTETKIEVFHDDPSTKSEVKFKVKVSTFDEKLFSKPTGKEIAPPKPFEKFSIESNKLQDFSNKLITSSCNKVGHSSATMIKNDEVKQSKKSYLLNKHEQSMLNNFKKQFQVSNELTIELVGNSVAKPKPAPEKPNLIKKSKIQKVPNNCWKGLNRSKRWVTHTTKKQPKDNLNSQAISENIVERGNSVTLKPESKIYESPNLWVGINSKILEIIGVNPNKNDQTTLKVLEQDKNKQTTFRNEKLICGTNSNLSEQDKETDKKKPFPNENLVCEIGQKVIQTHKPKSKNDKTQLFDRISSVSGIKTHENNLLNKDVKPSRGNNRNIEAVATKLKETRNIEALAESKDNFENSNILTDESLLVERIESKFGDKSEAGIKESKTQHVEIKVCELNKRNMRSSKEILTNDSDLRKQKKLGSQSDYDLSSKRGKRLSQSEILSNENKNENKRRTRSTDDLETNLDNKQDSITNCECKLRNESDGKIEESRKIDENKYRKKQLNGIDLNGKSKGESSCQINKFESMISNSINKLNKRETRLSKSSVDFDLVIESKNISNQNDVTDSKCLESGYTEIESNLVQTMQKQVSAIMSDNKKSDKSDEPKKNQKRFPQTTLETKKRLIKMSNEQLDRNLDYFLEKSIENPDNERNQQKLQKFLSKVKSKTFKKVTDKILKTEDKSKEIKNIKHGKLSTQSEMVMDDPEKIIINNESQIKDDQLLFKRLKKSDILKSEEKFEYNKGILKKSSEKIPAMVLKSQEVTDNIKEFEDTKEKAEIFDSNETILVPESKKEALVGKISDKTEKTVGTLKCFTNGLDWDKLNEGLVQDNNSDKDKNLNNESIIKPRLNISAHGNHIDKTTQRTNDSFNQMLTSLNLQNPEELKKPQEPNILEPIPSENSKKSVKNKKKVQFVQQPDFKIEDESIKLKNQIEDEKLIDSLVTKKEKEIFKNVKPRGRNLRREIRRKSDTFLSKLSVKSHRPKRRTSDPICSNVLHQQVKQIDNFSTLKEVPTGLRKAVTVKISESGVQIIGKLGKLDKPIELAKESVVQQSTEQEIFKLAEINEVAENDKPERSKEPDIKDILENDSTQKFSKIEENGSTLKELVRNSDEIIFMIDNCLKEPGKSTEANNNKNKTLDDNSEHKEVNSEMELQEEELSDKGIEEAPSVESQSIDEQNKITTPPQIEIATQPEILPTILETHLVEIPINSSTKTESQLKTESTSNQSSTIEKTNVKTKTKRNISAELNHHLENFKFPDIVQLEFPPIDEANHHEVNLTPPIRQNSLEDKLPSIHALGASNTMILPFEPRINFGNVEEIAGISCYNLSNQIQTKNIIESIETVNKDSAQAVSVIISPLDPYESNDPGFQNESVINYSQPTILYENQNAGYVDPNIVYTESDIENILAQPPTNISEEVAVQLIELSQTPVNSFVNQSLVSSMPLDFSTINSSGTSGTSGMNSSKLVGRPTVSYPNDEKLGMWNVMLNAKTILDDIDESYKALETGLGQENESKKPIQHELANNLVTIEHELRNLVKTTINTDSGSKEVKEFVAVKPSKNFIRRYSSSTKTNESDEQNLKTQEMEPAEGITKKTTKKYPSKPTRKVSFCQDPVRNLTKITHLKSEQITDTNQIKRTYVVKHDSGETQKQPAQDTSVLKVRITRQTKSDSKTEDWSSADVEPLINLKLKSNVPKNVCLDMPDLSEPENPTFTPIPTKTSTPIKPNPWIEESNPTEHDSILEESFDNEAPFFNNNNNNADVGFSTTILEKIADPDLGDEFEITAVTNALQLDLAENKTTNFEELFDMTAIKEHKEATTQASQALQASQELIKEQKLEVTSEELIRDKVVEEVIPINEDVVKSGNKRKAKKEDEVDLGSSKSKARKKAKPVLSVKVKNFKESEQVFLETTPSVSKEANMATKPNNIEGVNSKKPLKEETKEIPFKGKNIQSKPVPKNDDTKKQKKSLHEKPAQSVAPRIRLTRNMKQKLQAIGVTIQDLEQSQNLETEISKEPTSEAANPEPSISIPPTNIKPVSADVYDFNEESAIIPKLVSPRRSSHKTSDTETLDHENSRPRKRIITESFNEKPTKFQLKRKSIELKEFPLPISNPKRDKTSDVKPKEIISNLNTIPIKSENIPLPVVERNQSIEAAKDYFPKMDESMKPNYMPSGQSLRSKTWKKVRNGQKRDPPPYHVTGEGVFPHPLDETPISLAQYQEPSHPHVSTPNVSDTCYNVNLFLSKQQPSPMFQETKLIAPKSGIIKTPPPIMRTISLNRSVNLSDINLSGNFTQLMKNVEEDKVCQDSFSETSSPTSSSSEEVHHSEGGIDSGIESSQDRPSVLGCDSMQWASGLDFEGMREFLNAPDLSTAGVIFDASLEESTQRLEEVRSLPPPVELPIRNCQGSRDPNPVLSSASNSVDFLKTML